MTPRRKNNHKTYYFRDTSSTISNKKPSFHDSPFPNDTLPISLGRPLAIIPMGLKKQPKSYHQLSKEKVQPISSRLCQSNLPQRLKKIKYLSNFSSKKNINISPHSYSKKQLFPDKKDQFQHK